MKKALKKVASGLVRDAEKSWFAELSDKGKMDEIYHRNCALLLNLALQRDFKEHLISVKCTKTHIYYAMKNCNGDADVLRNYIINIVDHYQALFHFRQP